MVKPARSAKSPAAGRPLSEDERGKLLDLLEEHSPLDEEGLLGLFHALAAAPSEVPSSVWLEVVLPGGAGSTSEREARDLVLRLQDEVASCIRARSPLTPDPDDVAACESFTSGFVEGAELDPSWIGNDDLWTFASWAAFLAGRQDLVPAHLLSAFEEHGQETKDNLRRDMGALVMAVYDSVGAQRQGGAGQGGSRASRVGRNDPCPCGSGKKYKKCCVDAKVAPG